jgi:hypothetical protein
MSEGAARVALASLLAAARAESEEGRRTGICEGLACTLVYMPGAAGMVIAPTWRVLTPDKTPLFHSPGASTSALEPVARIEEQERPSVLLME